MIYIRKPGILQPKPTAEVRIFIMGDVVLRSFPIASGHGFTDYLLYVKDSAARVIEEKKDGLPLIGVATLAEMYNTGVGASRLVVLISDNIEPQRGQEIAVLSS